MELGEEEIGREPLLWSEKEKGSQRKNKLKNGSIQEFENWRLKETKKCDSEKKRNKREGKKQANRHGTIEREKQVIRCNSIQVKLK